MKKSLEELKQFVIANLGKSVKEEEGRHKGEELMIVGYSLDTGMLGISKFVILSLTTNYGWTSLYRDDIILLHSPLNKSLTYIDMYLLKEMLYEQEQRIE